MSLIDLLPIVLPILGILFLVILIVLLLRRARRRAAQRAAAQRAKAVAAASQDEDERLIASLAASVQPAPPSPAPEPAPKRLRDIPIPPPVAPEPTPTPKSAPPPSPSRTGDRIHILVVDDHRDTRENVSRLIAFESDMEVVGQAYNGLKGLEMAVEMQPEIVMMDINMPDMDGITATREMSVQAPYCQVIMMSVQIEREYMRNAMLAGARDYQTKPFTADELINCIRHVYQAAQPVYQQIEAARTATVAAAAAAAVPTEIAIMTGPMVVPDVPVFAVYSPRGGAGKSAIAIHLAVALQHEHPGVVLIDADLRWGNVPIDLNMPPTATVENLIPKGRAEPELLPNVLLPHSSGIKLLLAPQKPEMADLITANTMTQVIRTVKSRASAIVVDTPSYLTDHNLAVMEAADLTLLVITPDLPSVKNAKLFLELALELDLKLDRFALVINRATAPGGLPPKQIEKLFKLPHVYTIPDDPQMPLSGRKGVAIYQLSPMAPAGVAIAQMAHQAWQYVAVPAPVAKAAAPLPH